MKVAVIVILILSIPTVVSDQTHQHNVQFRVNSDHTFTPILPIKIGVDQEEGGLADGVITCDTVQRTENGLKKIVFKCNSGKVFVLTGLSFTSSE